MNIQRVVTTDFAPKLTNCLYKAEALIIPDRAPDFYNVNIATFTRQRNCILNGTRQVGHQLNCFTAKFPRAFIRNEIAEQPPCKRSAFLCHFYVQKSLVMPEV